MEEQAIKENRETQETTQQEHGVKLVPVRNSLSSGTRIVARGENGRFARSRKKLEQDLKITERVENDLKALITRPASDAEGKPILDTNGKPVPLHVAVAEKLLTMMLELKDEKAIGAAGKTLESILTRAIGKPSDSAVTRDALQHSGVRVVVIEAPKGLPVEEDKPKEILIAPSWVQTNPAKNADDVNPEELGSEEN